jgi:hypothetical protein
MCGGGCETVGGHGVLFGHVTRPDYPVRCFLLGLHTHTHTHTHTQTTGEMFLPATLLKYAPLLIAPEPETAASVADAQALFANAAQIPIRK